MYGVSNVGMVRCVIFCGVGTLKEVGDVFLLWSVSLLSALKTDASNTGKEVSTHPPCSSPLGPVTAYCRVSADPSSGQESQHIDVLLVGLKSHTQYKATVYSQAADGTKGQPRPIEFRTSMSDFV